MKLLNQLEEMELSKNKTVDFFEMDMYKLMDLTIEVGRLVFNSKLIKDIDEKRKSEAELKKVINAFEDVIVKYFEKDILNKNNIRNKSSKVYELFCCIISKIYEGGYEFRSDNNGYEKKELICNLAFVGSFVEGKNLKSSIESNEKVEMKLNLLTYLYYSYMNNGNNFMEEEAVVISEMYEIIIRYFKKENKDDLTFENLV